MKFDSKNKTSDNTFFELRQQVLELKRMPMSESIHPVYAAIVDMDMNNAVATLVCAEDGTASLYYSTGGGKLGFGQADENVRKAAINFLYNSEQILNKLAIVKNFPLPKNKKHIVYLITESGIFKQELNVNKISKSSKELQFLFFLYQNVLTKMREFEQRAK